MAGGLSRDHDSYNHFNAGYDSRVNPLSAIDKKILDFAVRTKQIPALKSHGQILRNFGMYPPEFWTRAQNLSEHRDVPEEHKSILSEMFPMPSRPGPMGGGADVDTESKKFSHGLEW
jgi:hypothetical protein